MASNNNVSMDNIYKLEGRVPVGAAIPFGLQHVLAMFVANVTPLIIIASVAQYNGVAFSTVDTARLIQNCMIIAGIGTLIQLFPIWRIGSGLPIVMGLSFTFLAACMTAASQDYGLMVGGIIVGGCIEGVLGLTAKYWRKIIQPIVAGCVVCAIGLSILNVGVSSYVSSGTYEVGAWQNLLVGTITLISCIVFNVLAKGFAKQLYVLFGLAVGYVVAIAFGMVNFADIGNTISEMGVFAIPKVFAFAPKFNIGIIISFVIVFLVSAVETIGDTTAACTGALGRDITDREVSGSLAVDGFCSALAGGVFGVSPITSFSQNVGLLKMTKVVNRFTIMFGALIMILGGLFPPIGAFLSTLPDCVLGGCTVIMFGSILVAGIEMISHCEFTQRNMIIVATSLCVGVGVTQVEGALSGLPSIISDIFAGNMVAGVFVVALILSLVLPKNMEIEKKD
ncbi:MAG: solute carrier family 23 protein [Lachnospiraceae bacterium]|nr:solute carrier family 23 protein [Lachnospiraceae bacterium]